MKHPAWELQKALFSLLMSDVDVVSRLGGQKLFDDVPRSASFPYVTFGAGQTVDRSSSDGTGYQHTLILNVWSRSGGRKEVLAIVELVRAAVLKQPVDLDDFCVVLARLEAVDVRRGSDGETYQGAMRFSFFIEEAAQVS